MKVAIPYSEYPKSMYPPVLTHEYLAKKALELGEMTQEQWELRGTHALYVGGYWIAVTKNIPATSDSESSFTRKGFTKLRK